MPAKTAPFMKNGKKVPGVRTRKSMYKTAVMICVAMVCVTFNVFVKSPQKARQEALKSSSNRSFSPINQANYDSGRKILWFEGDQPARRDEYEGKEVRTIFVFSAITLTIAIYKPLTHFILH